MKNLFDELQRLYFLPGQQWLKQTPGDGAAPVVVPSEPLTPELFARSLDAEMGLSLNLLNGEGCVRSLLVVFKRSADWPHVARLHEAVQRELGLPEPAVSASGRDGFRVWFSLAEALPFARVRRFLDGLRRRYLATLPAGHLAFRPDIENLAAPGPVFVKLTPALHAESGRWSAFIDPGMGSLFVDEPGLALAPNFDKQAQLLRGLSSISAADFEQALNTLWSGSQDLPELPELPAETTRILPTAATGPVGQFDDPESFLRAIMNDPNQPTLERIRAAEALLPRK